MAVLINAKEFGRACARRGLLQVELAKTAALRPQTIAAARHGKPISEISFKHIVGALAATPCLGSDITGLCDGELERLIADTTRPNRRKRQTEVPVPS